MPSIYCRARCVIEFCGTVDIDTPKPQESLAIDTFTVQSCAADLIMTDVEPALASPFTETKLRKRPSKPIVQQQSYRTKLSTIPSKVDFVISFKPTNDIDASSAQLQQLLQDISSVGLRLQVREGVEQGDVFVFVKCPLKTLQKEVYASRSRDWLSGIRVAALTVDETIVEEPITDSERLRLVFLILTAPKHENGAAITPKLGKWTCVESIFPLHNKEFDAAWIKRWATKWMIDDNELEHLCSHFGTKVAMYFAFLQFYSLSLGVPAALGLTAFILLPEYSVIFALSMLIWAIVFLELWERRQKQLALRWGVINCSQLEHKRAAFVGSTTAVDPITKQSVPMFNPFIRLARESLVVPFTVVAGGFLALVLTAIFAVEVFIGEVYDGPFKSVLTFTPTILFTLIVSPFSNLYMGAALKLTLYENHETDAGFNAAITRKSFVLNFLTSYMALFLTLYVYLPFGHLIVPNLDVLGLTATFSAYGLKSKPFVLDNDRIRNQLFYFAVTAQVVNLFMAYVLPIVLRMVKGEAKGLQAKITGQNTYKPIDRPEEATFLEKVRYESTLPEYDGYGDYAEMVIQFGYSVMFAPIWPLTPVCAFLNDIVELRTDAAKLCQNMRRPVPMRADSIGPWADNLSFLTWLGSLTTGSITYLLRGDAASTKPFLHMIAICLFAEHAYLALRKVISTVMSRFSNTTEIQIKQEELSIRRQYLSRLTSVDQPSAEIVEDNEFFQSDFSAISNLAQSIVRTKGLGKRIKIDTSPALRKHL